MRVGTMLRVLRWSAVSREEFEPTLGPHRRSNRQVEEAEEENWTLTELGWLPHMDSNPVR